MGGIQSQHVESPFSEWSLSKCIWKTCQIFLSVLLAFAVIASILNAYGCSSKYITSVGNEVIELNLEVNGQHGNKKNGFLIVGLQIQLKKKEKKLNVYKLKCTKMSQTLHMKNLSRDFKIVKLQENSKRRFVLDSYLYMVKSVENELQYDMAIPKDTVVDVVLYDNPEGFKRFLNDGDTKGAKEVITIIRNTTVKFSNFNRHSYNFVGVEVLSKKADWFSYKRSGRRWTYDVNAIPITCQSTSDPCYLSVEEDDCVLVYFHNDEMNKNLNTLIEHTIVFGIQRNHRTTAIFAVATGIVMAIVIGCYLCFIWISKVKGEKDIHDLMLAEKGFISFEEKGAYINKTVANTITTNTQFFASAAEEELSCIEYVQQTKLDQGTSMLVMKSVVRAEDSPISMHMFLSKRGLNSILRWIKIWKEQSRGFIFRRDEKRHDIQTFALAQVEPTYGQDFHVAPKTTNASNEVLQHCQRNYLPPLVLGMRPSFKMLMENIGSEIPWKWMEFGRMLGLDKGFVNNLKDEYSEEKKRFIAIFDEWERKDSPPYTWETVIKVLQYKTLDTKNIAEDLQERVLAKPTVELLPSEILSKWQELGETLNLEERYIQSLRQEYLHDGDRFMAILDKWGSEGTYPITWETVIDVLNSRKVQTKKETKTRPG